MWHVVRLWGKHAWPISWIIWRKRCGVGIARLAVVQRRQDPIVHENALWIGPGNLRGGIGHSGWHNFCLSAGSFSLAADQQGCYQANQQRPKQDSQAAYEQRVT